MMKRLLAFGLWLLAVGCSSGLTDEQLAADAALSYYNRLLEGYPDGFLAGKAGYDAMSKDECRQLVKANEQYLADMGKKHGGVLSVCVSGNVGRRDSLPGTDGKYVPVVYAFLLLSFNDSTQEEIVVPMVWNNGEWQMK